MSEASGRLTGVSQTNTTQLPDVSTLSYEQARDELVDVVRRLEAGSTALEDALTLWERGEALAARCQAWLDNARERLDSARSASAVGTETGGPDTEAAREAALDDAAAAVGEDPR
ncbi:exodeoxyribonuclease VII small subunit [Georgenia sp. SYP-B2076]|uniref:exodeoxyribonuclease VII small subunit n=1 Tax=Georgenia sp. SYP-B2076 TaxID=2495881 RepID=UPI000F8D7B55|nr:exodeoxyribonuclease VII small subunit [Georgenia sp. SYP-B2076]